MENNDSPVTSSDSVDSAVKRVEFKAEWTNDCQGKKDYDGPILTLSTRYWPRGGSFWVLTPGKGMTDQFSPERQDIKPSATASICIASGGEDGEYVDVIKDDFEAETEEEVKKQVEDCAQDRFKEIIGAVNHLYGTRFTTNPSAPSNETGDK